MSGTSQMVDPLEDHSLCCWSTGIHECLTVGQGELDTHGFWQRGCPTCARKHEEAHPESGPVWPHSDKDLRAMFPAGPNKENRGVCPEEKP